MATITRYPFLTHLRAASTAHVVQMSGGAVRRSAPGLTLWFRPLTAVLSEVPVDDRELPLVARARTLDLQQVTAQLTVSFRFADPELAARRLDFGLDPRSGHWTGDPLEQVARLLGELAAGHATDALSAMGLAQAVSAPTGALGARITAALQADDRVAAIGLHVLGARVASVRADADLERALQTPTREAVQAEADRSTYERRALVVERERAIAENELATRIELATREQGLVAQEGANARARAQEEAAAALIGARGRAEEQAVVAAAESEAVRVRGEAEGAAERARLAALAEVPVEVLHALALRELATHLPGVEQLTVTPDLVTGALAALTSGGARS